MRVQLPSRVSGGRLDPAASVEHAVSQAAHHAAEEGVELHAVPALAVHDNLFKERLRVEREPFVLRVVQRKGLERHAGDLPGYELREPLQRIRGVFGGREVDVLEVAVYLVRGVCHFLCLFLFLFGEGDTEGWMAMGFLQMVVAQWKRETWRDWRWEWILYP